MTVAQKNAEVAYPILVRKYIAEKYTVQDELAIRNNYDLDPFKYKPEYDKYQAYRVECKNRAKEELGLE